MPDLMWQLVAYGILVSVLLVHVGMAYRLYHRHLEPSALPFMGYLLATCGAGLAFVLNALLIQVIHPEPGMQVALLTRLLNLPFHGLVPFTLILFMVAHLGRSLTWRLKLVYWLGFGGLFAYDLGVHGWRLMHPGNQRLAIPEPLTGLVAQALLVAALAFWVFELFRMQDPLRRRCSALLAAALAAPHLLVFLLLRTGVIRLVIRTVGPTTPGNPLGAAGWDPILLALLMFWGPLPAYWILLACARLLKPAVKNLPEATHPLEPFCLSPRELEVATLVMQGRSNKEICDALFISMDTVKRHVSNVYRKTGVKNRVQLSRLLLG